MKPDPARRAAYDVLRAVSDRDAYANLVLPGLLRDRGMSGRDAAFATELTYGTARRRGSLDAVLAACADRPLDRLDGSVLDALRLGAYQLLHTRVPAHAAVSTTVALTPRRGAGYANAVLRAVAARNWPQWVEALAPAYADDPIGHLALASGHPRWIAAAYADALGGDLTETAAALAADDTPPVVHLAALPGRIERAALLAESGPGATAGPWSAYAVRLAGGDPGRLAAVRARRATVQDEGSQLVALALAGVSLDGPDRWWLDLTAGPGGKAALLAGTVAERSGWLLAVDRAAHRARLTARLLAGSPAGVVVADGRAPAWPDGRFDRVLLDAPCSGLGALRRRPDARWRRDPGDPARLAVLQGELLAAALRAVRAGGVVGYATCSPHLGETRAVVDAALAGDLPVVELDARVALPGVPDLGPGPHVQLWPHRHDTDAMFLALLQRR